MTLDEYQEWLSNLRNNMLSHQMFIEAIKSTQEWKLTEAEQLKKAAFDESANENPMEGGEKASN